ncbi:ABC-2 type transporter [Corchorus olitorius]|uniref:ABC-2 type transporter n=1 Tax=Corchorus olitorius TaxID=93759 RepID=A0A1R3IDH9_9ROSI|nr:ABC-2 type transporter [Corchorus olitorius]
MEGGDTYRASSIRIGSSNLWRNGSMEVFSKSSRGEEDEEALKWAAIEKLPTFVRIQTGIIAGEGGSLREIDVNNLGFLEKRKLLERLVKSSEQDHENFLRKLKERIDSRALPTMFNFSVNFFEGVLNYLQILPSRKKPFPILNHVSGIVKPGSYRDGILIKTFFLEIRHATSLEGQESNVVTDYVLKILGLEVCADIIVGDEMIRGISGGQKKRVTTGDELATPFDKFQSHPAALTKEKYGVSRKELLKACASREYLLMKRNSFVYIFKMTQLVILGFITMTIFLRTEMHRDTVTDGGIYMGALFFTLLMMMFNGYSDLAMTILKLPIFYKQRDFLFFPSWSYALPSWILKIPVSVVEVTVWMILNYYVIGFDPNVGRFFKQYLLLLCLNQMASGLFRFMAAVGRTMIVANTCGSLALLAILVMGGFILTRDDVKKWWLWGYWFSPLMYGQNAIAVNEFLGKKWSHIPPNSSDSLGVLVLKSRAIFPEAYWYWIGVGALTGYCLLFNFLFTLALRCLDPFGKPQAIISKETVDERNNNKTNELTELSSRGKTTSDSQKSTSSWTTSGVGSISDASQHRKRGMVLPFEPLSITFDEIRYAVDMPQCIGCFSDGMEDA